VLFDSTDPAELAASVVRGDVLLARSPDETGQGLPTSHLSKGVPVVHTESKVNVWIRKWAFADNVADCFKCLRVGGQKPLDWARFKWPRFWRERSGSERIRRNGQMLETEDFR